MPTRPRHTAPLLFLIAFCFSVGVQAQADPQAQAKANNKTMLVHYMPWYESKPVSGQWGWHWTMNRFDPEKIKSSGQREIASHTYPLIGPYDSNDPDALACHVQLMKLAGIDGAIIDWYGIHDFRDYAPIHQRTKHLITFLKRARLSFAICYEDRTIRPMVNTKKIAADQAITRAKAALTWADKYWFKDSAYVKINGRPILPVFGPMYFKTPQAWQKLFAGISPRPTFYALPHLAKRTNADGVFGWPPVHGGKEIPYQTWRNYLTDLYARHEDKASPIAIVFPQFHDIYEKSYGHIDDRKGETFKETLDLAIKSKAPIIQIATWNDFGEGTIIEPTAEFGYLYLEMLQSKWASQNKAFSYTKEDLRLPVQLYQLKKKHQKNGKQADHTKRFKQIDSYLFEGKCEKAKEAIARLGAGTGK